MAVEVLTKEDLQLFRTQLVADIKELLLSKQQVKKEWLRSSEIRKV